MANIYFNEDSNHFIFDRFKAGKRRIEKKDVYDFLAQYQNTGISDFMICVNWAYKSERFEGMMENYMRGAKSIDPTIGGAITNAVGLLTDLYEREGVTVVDLLFEYARGFGLRPWASIRMNDIHEASAEDSVLFDDFRRKNRHLNRVSHRAPSSYYDYAFDYHFPEVREYYLIIVQDALEHFDMDGLELDFMREIYSFGIGREYEGIAVMNAFMRDVYELVKEAEKRLGHPIEIAVRVPDTPEKALRLGFDVFDWVEAGLVDQLTVTSRWSSVDNELPIDLWKRIFKGMNVRIAAGLEILLDAYNRRGRKLMTNTFETAIASATAFLSQGADVIYLFNYMDMTAENFPHVSPLQEDHEQYHKFLTIAGDYEKCVLEHRRHVVTYDDVNAVGAAGQKQLPRRFYGTRGNAPEFSALRVVTGEIPAERTVNVVLGFTKNAEYRSADIIVYLNAKPCRLAGAQNAHDQQYTDMNYYVFEAENDGNIPPVCVIEIGLADGKTELHWAEIEII